MSFGLTNAPSTFQALMNDVLKPFIRRSVLVFFDDILIYSPWAEHLHNVRAVLQLMHDHRLFLKQSKCIFGAQSVGYLGHTISGQGVAMDLAKVEAMCTWPQPTTMKAVCGFLGLTGYYRKFIRSYGELAAPLTQLLKREAFLWTPATDTIFNNLKMALTTGPVM